MSESRETWNTSTCSSSAQGFPESARPITSRRNVRPEPTQFWTAEAAIGGTWDLFRYPGVRSDSDMHTLGYKFRPWRRQKGDRRTAPSIREYIAETAQEYGIDQKIRFEHQVTQASWSSRDARWTVRAISPDGQTVQLTCNFLCMCSGYYDYAEGYMPGWPGMEQYQGRVVHPQSWPEDLDYAGKRIVVIGSGATAVTLVPALAATAAHVTMLQRSPTYIVARPSNDRAAGWLRRLLPERLALRLIRWKNVLLGMYFYNLSRRRPEWVKQGDPAARARTARPRLRCRKALRAQLQPVGPARLRGS